jgi:hypothetical protein
VTVGGGDVGDAGEAERADGGVAEGGHDLRSGAGADLGAVLVVGDVPYPVNLVLDVVPAEKYVHAGQRVFRPARTTLAGRVSVS